MGYTVPDFSMVFRVAAQVRGCCGCAAFQHISENKQGCERGVPCLDKTCVPAQTQTARLFLVAVLCVVTRAVVALCFVALRRNCGQAERGGEQKWGHSTEEAKELIASAGRAGARPARWRWRWAGGCAGGRRLLLSKSSKELADRIALCFREGSATERIMYIVTAPRPLRL